MMKKLLAALLSAALLTGLLSVGALAATLSDGTVTFTLTQETTGTTEFTQTAYVLDANGRYVKDENGKFKVEQVTKTAWVVPEGTVVTTGGTLVADLYYHHADGDYWEAYTCTDILSGAKSLTIDCRKQLEKLQADGLNVDRVIFRVRGAQSYGLSGLGVQGVGTGIYLTSLQEAPVEPDPEPVVTVPVFSDVKEGDWFYPGVTACAQVGLIAGREDGSFAPKIAMTWAQAVTLAVRVAQYRAGQAVYGPADQTGEHWYDIYVEYARTNGILTGEDVDWNALITRGEAIVLFAGVAGEYETVNQVPDSFFTDLEPGSDVEAAAVFLARAGMCNGTDANKFSPDALFHRHEVATMAARMTGLIPAAVVSAP